MKGFTLVEVLLALVLALAIGGAASRLILIGQRVGRGQVERLAEQENLRTGVHIVANELRELGFDSLPAVGGVGWVAPSSDILVGEVGRIRYRAMRGIGFTCGAPAPTQLLLREATWVGLRQPAANVDSVALYLEADPDTTGDDGWTRARVTGVAGGTCADGTRAIALTTAWESPPLADGAMGRIALGGPVRIFETMEIQYYPQDGRMWLGMRSLSRGEAIQPLLGPLTAFSLGYLDREGRTTSVMTDVRAIALALRGESGLTLGTRIGLRNAGRP
jgi:prepilin-type N-terminal cleavage/methylation domain-containing protein